VLSKQDPMRSVLQMRRLPQHKQPPLTSQGKQPLFSLQHDKRDLRNEKIRLKFKLIKLIKKINKICA
jgi:hypothetical protein